MDELSGQLELGTEIARGANGAVHGAVLYGAAVCAKVRRRAPPAACRALPSRYPARCVLQSAACCSAVAAHAA